MTQTSDSAHDAEWFAQWLIRGLKGYVKNSSLASFDRVGSHTLMYVNRDSLLGESMRALFAKLPPQEQVALQDGIARALQKLEPRSENAMVFSELFGLARDLSAISCLGVLPELLQKNVFEDAEYGGEQKGRLFGDAWSMTYELASQQGREATKSLILLFQSHWFNYAYTGLTLYMLGRIDGEHFSEHMDALAPKMSEQVLRWKDRGDEKPPKRFAQHYIDAIGRERLESILRDKGAGWNWLRKAVAKLDHK